MAKSILITGANSGIGKAASIELARAGHEVIMGCRDESRGNAARKEIMEASGSDAIELLLVDVSEVESITSMVSKFLETHDSLDVLVNNAGGIFYERLENSQGVELTFATNVMGPFALSCLLAKALKKAAPSRVVNVSSDAHLFFKVKPDDLLHERGYNSFLAYARAKNALVMITKRFAALWKDDGVDVNAMHPGFINTKFGKSGSGFLKAMIAFSYLAGRSPEAGAKTEVFLASDESVQGITGKYFAGKKEKKPNKQVHDVAVQEAVWKKCVELTGITPE